MSGRELVLFPMMEAGAGHRVPAEAIATALERIAPGRFETRLVDLARACGARRDDRFIKQAWDFALRFPWIGELGYRGEDALWPASMYYLPIAHPEYYLRGMRYLAELAPRFVVSTHYFTSMIAAAARKKFRASWGFASFSTDPYAGHGWWRERGADVVIVGSEQAKRQMVSAGFPERKVFVSPFPVRRAFYEEPPADRGKLVEEMGLDPALPILLVMAGGQGIGRNVDYSLRAWAEGIPANFLVVCGKNLKARENLDRAIAGRARPGRLRALGFTREVPRLVSCCDLVVTKPSPSSMFESLVMGKPAIFTQWVTGQERANMAWSRKLGLTRYIPGYRDFFRALSGLCSDGTLLEGFSRRVRLSGVREAHRGADERVARFLLGLIDGQGKK